MEYISSIRLKKQQWSQSIDLKRYQGLVDSTNQNTGNKRKNWLSLASTGYSVRGLGAPRIKNEDLGFIPGVRKSKNYASIIVINYPFQNYIPCQSGNIKFSSVLHIWIYFVCLVYQLPGNPSTTGQPNSCCRHNKYSNHAHNLVTRQIYSSRFYCFRQGQLCHQLTIILVSSP